MVLVSWAPTTVLKLMGSYLVFVVAGFILVLFCLEAQSTTFTQSSSSSSPSAAAAAESNVQKSQLKVNNYKILTIILYSVWVSDRVVINGDVGCSFLVAYRRAYSSSPLAWSRGRQPSGFF